MDPTDLGRVRPRAHGARGRFRTGAPSGLLSDSSAVGAGSAPSPPSVRPPPSDLARDPRAVRAHHPRDLGSPSPTSLLERWPPAFSSMPRGWRRRHARCGRRAAGGGRWRTGARATCVRSRPTPDSGPTSAGSGARCHRPQRKHQDPARVTILYEVCAPINGFWHFCAPTGALLVGRSRSPAARWAPPC